MKKIIVFLALLFFINMPTSKAYEIVEDPCVDEGTCLVLCSYDQESHISFSEYDHTAHATIYYEYATGYFKVKWENPVNANEKVHEKKGVLNYVFSTSDTAIYNGTPNTIDSSNFVCPTYAYIDTDYWTRGNELCFDNDGATCKNNFSNSGTEFGKGDFRSTSKIYDFENEITNYARATMDYLKEEITKGTFDILEDYQKMLEEDFYTNFLHKNTMPPFLANSPAYKKLAEDLEKEYNRVKAEALEKAEEDHQKGTITDAEYEDIKDNWSATETEIKNTFTSSLKNLTEKINWTADFTVTSKCNSYLGNPKIKNTPAYYLQFVFNLIKYISIIILFVLTIVDFVKAIVSSNQDALKKAIQTTVKRFIIVVVIFFLPILIRFLLTVLGAYSPTTCGIG